MGRVGRGISLLAIFLALGSYASARPVIFVPEAEGYAWWAREFGIRPMGTSARGVSAESINSWLATKAGMRSPAKICHLEAIENDSIVSAKRSTQLEIDQTILENPNSFRQIFTSRSGENFTVQVVGFELCGSTAGGRTGLLITNEQGLFVSFIESDFYFTRLLRRADGKLNVYGCFACGDVNEISYNPDEREFYLKWIGH